MLAQFDLVVFDWDGTLINSTATIARAIQAAAADLQLPVPDDETALHVIGLGLQDALRRAVPSITPEQVAPFAERYRYHYLAAEDSLVLFTGVRELLAALQDQNVLLAVATGKNKVGLARALEATKLAPVFAATRCADQTHPKPHPAMLLELSEQLRVPLTRTLMVGDTTHDLQMAAAAQAQAVGVTYGAHPKQVLAQCPLSRPLTLVDSVAQLHQWLLPH